MTMAFTSYIAQDVLRKSKDIAGTLLKATWWCTAERDITKTGKKDRAHKHQVAGACRYQRGRDYHQARSVISSSLRETEREEGRWIKLESGTNVKSTQDETARDDVFFLSFPSRPNWKAEKRRAAYHSGHITYYYYNKKEQDRTWTPRRTI